MLGWQASPCIFNTLESQRRELSRDAHIRAVHARALRSALRTLVRAQLLSPREARARHFQNTSGRYLTL
jgi:hypothetical protein